MTTKKICKRIKIHEGEFIYKHACLCVRCIESGEIVENEMKYKHMNLWDKG